MQVNLEKIIYFIVFALLSSLLLIYAQSGYPMFGSDSYSFLPTAIHLHRGDGLINELYTPTGSTSVLFYPPFFPWFQSLFLFSNKPNAIYYSLSITSILCLFFMMLVFYRSLKKIENPGHRLFLYILLMLALNTSLDISSGRPEILINLLLSIAVFVYVYKVKLQEYIYGILLICIGLTSPITGIYCTLLLLLFYLYNKSSYKTYLKSAAAAFVLFVLFLMVYPYSFFEMIQTMISEAKKIVFARDDAYTLKEFIKYHFISPSYTFFFLLFVVSTLIVLSKIYTSIYKLVLLVILFSLIAYFGFRNLPTNYYVYNLSIIYFICILNFIPTYKKYVILMLLLCSIGTIRRGVLFAYFYDTQATIIHTQEKLKQCKITNFHKNSSMWLFYYYQEIKTNNLTESVELHQQMYSSKDTYESIPNVEYDFSNYTSLRIGSITIANNPPFYYYKLSAIPK